MASRYQCKLSKEVLAKAIEELNEPENDAERLEAIDQLRDAFKAKNQDLKLLREDDHFILRFLRARKFNQERALQLLTNHHKHREVWPEVFDKVKNPILLKHVFEKGVVCPIEGKAKNGSTVIVVRPGIEECNNLTDIFPAMFLTANHLLENEETQIHGVTVLQDLAYFNTEIFKQMSPVVAKRFAFTIQDCIPMRLKGIHITNEPKIFDVLFAIVQPFLKEKTKKRFFVHGIDFTKLYTTIDRSVLPFLFAGSGPELDINGWKSVLLDEGTAL